MKKRRLQLPIGVTPWLAIGGASTHVSPMNWLQTRLLTVVIDSAASFGIKPIGEAQAQSTISRPYLFVLFANHTGSLAKSVSKYQQVLASRSHSLSNMWHTLLARGESTSPIVLLLSSMAKEYLKRHQSSNPDRLLSSLSSSLDKLHSGPA